MKVKIKLIQGGKLPVFKTEGAACADCYARLDESITLYPKCRATIPLGFAVELPHGYELQIRPRSGLSKNGIDEVFGTGDEDYTGEYAATIINNSNNVFTIKNGDRICQCGIREVPEIAFDIVDEIKKTTERGDKGFGSTGV